jgi:hypothetical protein
MTASTPSAEVPLITPRAITKPTHAPRGPDEVDHLLERVVAASGPRDVLGDGEHRMVRVGDGDRKADELQDGYVFATIGHVGHSLRQGGVSSLELVETCQLVGHAEPVARQTQTLHARSRTERRVARQRNHRNASLAQAPDRLAVTHAEELRPASRGPRPRDLGVGERAVDVDDQKLDLRKGVVRHVPRICYHTAQVLRVLTCFAFRCTTSRRGHADAGARGTSRACTGSARETRCSCFIRAKPAKPTLPSSR